MRENSHENDDTGPGEVIIQCGYDIYQDFPIGKSKVWACPIGAACWYVWD